MTSPQRRSKSPKQSQRPSEKLPGIHERLAGLRPSRELLEFYRGRIADYEGEYEALLGKVEQFHEVCDEQSKSHWELRKKNDEIAQLQRALTDMQTCLFQEREHVLRLYAENDRLKIRELEDRKRIQQLLAVTNSGTGGAVQEVSYFLKEPQNSCAVVEQHSSAAKGKQLTPRSSRASPSKRPKSRQSSSANVSVQRSDSPDCQSLYAEARQAEHSEQVRLLKAQIEQLNDDRRARMQEVEDLKRASTEQVDSLRKQLQKTQDLLYQNTKDFLQLKYDNRAVENKYLLEKDTLMQKLDACQEQLTNVKRTAQRERTGARSSKETGRVDLNLSDVITPLVQERDLEHEMQVRDLEERLKESEKMCDHYREQICGLEDELGRVKEEGDVGQRLFRQRSDKMAQRLQLLNKRYSELEQRRALEVEGFKTDIRQLRQRIKTLERSLVKATLFKSSSTGLDEPAPSHQLARQAGQLEMRVLRQTEQTAQRSKNIMGELRLLKSKMYGLEQDLRHL